MTAITEQKARTVREVLSGSLLRRIVLIRKNGTAQCFRADQVSRSILNAEVEYDSLYNAWTARFNRGPFQQVTVYEPVAE